MKKIQYNLLNNLHNYFFILLFGVLNAQSKKEVILVLEKKIDSLYLLQLVNKNNFEKEIDKLQFEKYRSESIIKSLRCKTDSIEKINNYYLNIIQELKIQNVKSEENIKLLNKRISQLKDSLNSTKNSILFFRKEPDDFTLISPFLFAALQFKNNEIKGYIIQSTQSEQTYFIQGFLNNKIYNGNIFLLGDCQNNCDDCQNNCDSVIGKFYIDIQDSILNLNGELKNGSTLFFNDYKIPIFDELIEFSTNVTFYNEAKINSIKLDLEFDSSLLINQDNFIEIGKFEKIKGLFGVWCKFNINNKLVWVFCTDSLEFPRI